MKIHDLKTGLALACICLLAISAGHPSDGQGRASKNQWSVSAHSIRVKILTSSIEVPNVLSEMWYGNGPSPRNVSTNRVNHIALMQVYDATGKEIRCPVSAWSDLGNVNRVSIKPQHQGFHVVIGGGDGAVGYEAILYFSKGLLTRRKVSDGVGDGTDKDAFEVTKYIH